MRWVDRKAVAGLLGILSALALPSTVASARQTAPDTKAAAVPLRSAKAANPGVIAKQAQAERLARITAVKSWGYQLVGLSLEEAEASPYDLLVVDATMGLADKRGFTPEEVARLKRKPDGSRRIVVSYLSVGEAEDYRPDYFDPEYMTEDAPDWLLQENKDWKGNRLIRFCNKGWQATILGDEDGRNVYNSIDPSPLHRLIELGFDGIYLDRVDVYSEIAEECPDGARKMVEFIGRLGASARKRDPHFMVILQNAEELLKHKSMMATIDAIAKESLFHGWGGDTEDSAEIAAHLKLAKAAGRGVFVVDYPADRTKSDRSIARIKALGFVPYVAPKELDRLWLPGRDY